LAKKKNYGKRENKLLYAEKKCHHCGREFYPTPHWVYKITCGSRERIFCKYTCKTAYERERETRKQAVSTV
jgi:hypothetical protein